MAKPDALGCRETCDKRNYVHEQMFAQPADHSKQ